MKKLPVAVLTIAIILAVPMALQAATINLVPGARGAAVKTLQTQLTTAGYPTTVDGIFGKNTEQELVKFQAANGLTADGIDGPRTNHALLTDSIIAQEKSFIGVPYLWGGTTPSGFDCSGLQQYVFAKNGITLPRVSIDQSKVGTEVAYANLKPGDLMFFDMDLNGVVNHVGLYMGNGYFIGAEAAGVRIVTIDSWWIARFEVARSVY